MLLAQSWERFKVMNPNLSQYKIDEVEKMLHYRDPKYGFLQDLVIFKNEELW